MTPFIEKWIKQTMVDQQTMGQPLKVLREKNYYRVTRETNWTKLSEMLGPSIEDLHQLNPKLASKSVIFEGAMIVYPGKALNVSYSEEGLKWTSNKFGRLLYFADAFITHEEDGSPKFTGNVKKDKKKFVEDFIPRDHFFNGRMNEETQRAEFLWVDKGLRLLYSPNTDPR